MTDSKEDGLLPCPLCGSAFLMAQEQHDNHPVAGKFYIYHDYGPIGSDARKCRLSVDGHFDSAEEATAAWNRRASSPPVGGSGEVVVKPLEWHGPDIRDEYTARSMLGPFVIGRRQRNGTYWSMGAYHPTLNEAKAAAQADYENRIRSALAAPVPNGVPEGAIVNGRTLIDRLEHHYQFACEGGSLAMCSEWQDLVRCFEHLADYAAASPVTPEGLSGGDGWIAWEGGDDPLPPKTRVEVRLRCDQYTIGPAVSFWWGRDDTDRTYDIVAYRLANPV